MPMMSKTSRARLPKDTTTAINTVQLGGLGAFAEERSEVRENDSKI